MENFNKLNVLRKHLTVYKIVKDNSSFLSNIDKFLIIVYVIY